MRRNASPAEPLFCCCIKTTYCRVTNLGAQKSDQRFLSTIEIAEFPLAFFLDTCISSSLCKLIYSIVLDIQ